MTRKAWPRTMAKWLRDFGIRRCSQCWRWSEDVNPTGRMCHKCSALYERNRYHVRVHGTVLPEYIDIKAQRPSPSRTKGPRSRVAERDDLNAKANEYFARQVVAARGYYSDPAIIQHLSQLAGVRL